LNGNESQVAVTGGHARRSLWLKTERAEALLNSSRKKRLSEMMEKKMGGETKESLLDTAHLTRWTRCGWMVGPILFSAKYTQLRILVLAKIEKLTISAGVRQTAAPAWI
jgi:hypothetical protein